MDKLTDSNLKHLIEMIEGENPYYCKFILQTAKELSFLRESIRYISEELDYAKGKTQPHVVDYAQGYFEGMERALDLLRMEEA